MDQDLISIFSQNPTLGLKLIVENNPLAVKNKLESQGIPVSARPKDLYNTIAKLLNSGENDIALLSLSVPVIKENLPAGYYEDLREAGAITPEFDISVQNEEQDTDTTDGENDNSFKWGDFFDFASEIVVGLWGTQPYGANPYGPNMYQKKDNTLLYVIIAVLVIIVLTTLFISIRKK